jgi:hypothetical protein
MSCSLLVVLRVTLGWPVVCREIVERYEERSWAESEPGERFAFVCAIPWGKGVEK